MTKKHIITEEDEGAVVRQEVRLSKLALRCGVSAEHLDSTLRALAEAILAEEVADEDAAIEKWLKGYAEMLEFYLRVDIYGDQHLAVSDEEAAAAPATPKTYTPEEEQRTQEFVEKFGRAYQKALNADAAAHGYDTSTTDEPSEPASQEPGPKKVQS